MSDEYTWAFEDIDTPTTKPELGNIVVGGTVVVIHTDIRHKYTCDGTVTKVGPVWVTVGMGGPSNREYRFRKDSQEDPTVVGCRVLFRTPEQHRYEVAREDSQRYLKGAGIMIDRGSKVNVVSLAQIVCRSGLV